ncbi:MAG: hypothetical protein RBS35_04670 [Azonexus sp.]|jgi:hypothetical protein|nr:hypothetical protein [Azonexus sp.]
MSFSKTEMQEDLLKFLTLLGQEIASLYGAGDNTWTDEEAIKTSPAWNAVSEMYDYGVMGIPTEDLGPGGTVNGVHARIELFFRAMDTLPMRLYLNEFNNALPHLALRAIQSAVARMVLEGGNRYTDYGTDEHGLGNGEWNHLTLAEIALLANMDERSVRNAANPKLPDPLKTEQIGKRSLVSPAEGRRWLAGRKGFIPTQESEVAIAPLRSWNIELSEEIVERIQKEAEKAGIDPSIHLKNKVLEAFEAEMNEGKKR